ncbi:hypothetical protein [Timonella sp. A28]|uniref:hypothetical protein n=1 Tax=Timonella sp. A28 TaxID=3442640 RepID=UPI003EB74DF7
MSIAAAFALTAIAFLVLALITGLLADETRSHSAEKKYATVANTALGISTTLFIAAIWTHALT